MAVTAVGPATAPARARTRSAPATRSTFSIETAGVLIVLLGAWGGIVPFVGPLFGFSGDGSAAWRWNMAHALLGLAPGAVAVAAGLLVMLAGGALYRPGGLVVGGFFAALCGAWFVIGPVAWPVLGHSSTYLVQARPLRELAYWAGYSLGTGALLVGVGAFVLGHPVPEPEVIGSSRSTRAA